MQDVLLLLRYCLELGIQFFVFHILRQCQRLFHQHCLFRFQRLQSPAQGKGVNTTALLATLDEAGDVQKLVRNFMPGLVEAVDGPQDGPVQFVLIHASPTMDEDKLHQAILESINIFVLAGQGLGTELLDLASLVRQDGSVDGIDPLALRRRLEALTTEQAALVEQVLALEDMENEELNARLKAVTDEKEDILRQLGALRQDEEWRAGQEAGRRELAEWLERQQTEFAGYEDAITRKYVERITVLDAEAIRVKFKYTDVEIDRTIRK